MLLHLSFVRCSRILKFPLTGIHWILKIIIIDTENIDEITWFDNCLSFPYIQFNQKDGGPSIIID